MNNRLYYKNPYLTEFKAKILEKLIINSQCAIVLDNTAFYPTSGGQPNDLGYIQNIPIVDVVKDNEKIIHILKENIQENSGDIIVGKIDWNRRFDHMQQHTGQHILSAVLLEILNKDTLSFHMGEDLCTIDIYHTVFGDREVEKLEERANKITFENKPIYQYFTDDYDGTFRKKVKKVQELNEKLRIIEIENYDLTTCGGTHCTRTGEVGIIKIIKWENRKDKLRIYFHCGLRALRNYRQEHKIVQNIAGTFTTGVNKLEEKILQVLNDQKELNKKCRRMTEELIKLEARDMEKNNSVQVNGVFIINKLFSDSEKSDPHLKKMAFMLNRGNKSLVVLATEKPEPAICLFRSQDLFVNMNKVIKKILDEYNGHGGGSEFLAIGKFSCNDDVRNAYEKVTELFMEMYGNNI